VRFQPTQPTLLEPLGGEQQVHAEAPAEASDGGEYVREFRAGVQQFGEFVDDDEQRRHVAGVRGVEVCRAGVSGRAQPFLAAVHLAEQRILHPVDEDRLLRQVRDDRRGMGEPFHPCEGRAALEVDEDEVQLIGAVVMGEAGDDRPQQLTLARSGGADAQPVGADAALRRLPDVEVHRRRVRPDRCAQPATGQVEQRGRGPVGRPGPAEHAEFDVAEVVGGAEIAPAVDGPGGEDAVRGTQQQAAGAGESGGGLVGIGDDGHGVPCHRGLPGLPGPVGQATVDEADPQRSVMAEPPVVGPVDGHRGGVLQHQLTLHRPDEAGRSGAGDRHPRELPQVDGDRGLDGRRAQRQVPQPHRAHRFQVLRRPVDRDDQRFFRGLHGGADPHHPGRCVRPVGRQRPQCPRCRVDPAHRVQLVRPGAAQTVGQGVQMPVEAPADLVDVLPARLKHHHHAADHHQGKHEGHRTAAHPGQHHDGDHPEDGDEHDGGHEQPEKRLPVLRQRRWRLGLHWYPPRIPSTVHPLGDGSCRPL
jgi:hypothetical protein